MKLEQFPRGRKSDIQPQNQLNSLHVRDKTVSSGVLSCGLILSFPGGSDGKQSACNAGDWSSIPGLGRSPGEGNGYSLQYSCVKNTMDRGAWQAIVHGVAKGQT